MTVRFVRIAALLSLAAFALAATASSAGLGAPKNLHGFLLRADEPVTTAFHRTPSFAWAPVPGARTYQFQIATSNTFRDNGVLYNNAHLLTPVAAPSITLPWITGSPHALYARVRAVTDTTTSPWSEPWGFDVTPPAPPKPQPSYPGVLRWTPIEGADLYQVWLVDVNKYILTKSNVIDEREFYSFHTDARWTGSIRWRIRTLRGDVFSSRVNGVPVAMHGAWSPVYTSTNPAVTTGPVSLVGTVSDVFSNGAPTSPAHEMMPAFLWTGNQTLYGTSTELARVEIFTDAQCLNRVYTGSIVGGPSWSPRMNGPLGLPSDPNSLTAARGGYLGDGKEANSYTFDGDKLDPNEQQATPQPTTGLPGDVPAFPGTKAPDTSPGDTSDTSAGSTGITVGGDTGPPVSLWDVDWPKSGYYWTVIPVDAVGAQAAGTQVASPGSAKGSTTVPVASTLGFRVGDTVQIGSPPSVDIAVVQNIGAGAFTLASATGFGHFAGEPVTRAGGSITYVDAELPQDVCAAGRVQRLGISSEPSLTSAQAPFATGLSSAGRLTSAVHTSAFYGQPLVAWTPAFDASLYEVQYSKTRYPFKPEVDPRTQGKGYLTWSTSTVLPVGPGTWWYRVRGIDFNLPTGVQQMGWSDPEQLLVAKPKFRVAPAKGKKFKVVGGK
jgi:hypothetical protein